MKLLTTLTIAAIAVTFNVSVASAETCEGGSLQTGENGHVYCLSNNAMNWWTAYTWCQTQGRHLVTMYEVCPTWDGAGSNCNLSTFISDPYMWSATALGNNQAFRFDKSSVRAVDRTIAASVLCY